MNLDANAVSFISNCSYLLSNIFYPNAQAFLPYKMLNDNCAISTICSSILHPISNFASFISMPSSLNVYATPYIPLGLRLSSSVLNPNATHFPYKDGTIYTVILIPSRAIDITFTPLIEALVIEINLKKKRWLLICSYNPHKSMIPHHLYDLGKGLD